MVFLVIRPTIWWDRSDIGGRFTWMETHHPTKTFPRRNHAGFGRDLTTRHAYTQPRVILVRLAQSAVGTSRKCFPTWISTETSSCYHHHVTRVSSTDTSACYQHLVSWTYTSACYHLVSQVVTLKLSSTCTSPRYGEQKMAQFRTHYLTKELAYVSTQKSGQFYTLILNHFSVHCNLA